MDHVNELQDYFDNRDKAELAEYSIDRNEGIIDFAKRVYENGRKEYKSNPSNYIKFTKIAFENIMEFLSVRYPRIEDPTDRGACINRTAELLDTMSTEFHFFIHTIYSKWQENYSYLFQPQVLIDMGLRGFYYPHSSHSFSWNRKSDIDTITKNSDIGKYPKYFIEFGMSNLNQIDPVEPYITIPQNGYFITGPMFLEFNSGLPMIECDFSEEEFFRNYIKLDTYKESKKVYDGDKSMLVPTFARLIPDTTYDAVGQGGSYDLTVNYSTNVLRYAAIIKWNRRWNKFNIGWIGNNVLHERPAFSHATIFSVPYPEILDIEQFEKRIEEASKTLEKNGTIPPKEHFDSLNQKVRNIGYQAKQDKRVSYTTFYDRYLNDPKNTDGYIFETPSVSPDILFHPLLNLQSRKIRTVFISLYRIGKEPFLVNQLQQLVHNGAYVYAYVEPTARGDEKANQKIIKELEKYGVNVCHSCNGLKVHMKAWLVIYNDNSMLSMISTGNFNITTMKNYVDLHYITKDDAICKELLLIFKTLFTGGDFKSNFEYFNSKYRKILITPIAARDRIEGDIYQSKQNKEPIFIKCNNLTDSKMQSQLVYAAAQGSPMRMMIRTSTICSPSIQNIDIRSKVSRYLEHSRIYLFGDTLYISSADLMKRNLDRRLEIFLRIPEDCHYIKVHFSDMVNKDGILTGSSQNFSDYIDSIWESCNYKIDPLTLKWKVRK